MQRTPRTTVRRHPERADYERTTIDAVLDEALICHVGFVDAGHPYVIPTLHARDADTLFLHGSPGSRLLRTLATGVELCVTVTVLDGLVLARSVYHHSMNYRSVVVLGRAREIADEAEKLHAMRCLVEHVVPGRWADAREPSQAELSGTTVLALPLDEASAKVRTGPPSDRSDDLSLPIWAGVIPLELRASAPSSDNDQPMPAYAEGYERRRARGGTDAVDA